MEIINELLNNRKTYIIMIAAYVVIMIVVLVLIWMPKGEETFAKYEPYNKEASETKMMNYYMGNFINEIKYYDREYFGVNISKAYLNYTNQTIEELYQKIKINGKYNVTGLKTYEAGKKTIYSSSLVDSEKTTRINIIEAYPYNDYGITFGTFYDYIENNRTYASNGINFKLVSTYKDMDYIQYKFYITNNINNYVSIDLSTATKVYVTLSDGTMYYLNNIETSSNLQKLMEGQVVNKDLSFEVPVALQSSIKSITMLEVNVSGGLVNITISL